MQNPSNDALFSLFNMAVDEALAHEDSERFLRWCRDNVADYLVEAGVEVPLDTEGRELFGLHAGRVIWNALPLPGNELRPRRLPEPGRNDPCFCGSGRKFKQCCARFPHPLELDSNDMLGLVVSRLDSNRLAELQQSGRLPVAGLIALAETEVEASRHQKAAKLLEPLFAGEIRKTDDLHDQACFLLCNCYDELGWGRKKTELLQRIMETVPRSPLRSGAWQRLATIHMDAGDIKAAWHAFHQAQQDEPDSPHIGLLETQLHLATGEPEKARDRAGFWLQRLRRQGWEEQHETLQFFRKIAADPVGAMAEFGFQMINDAGAHLRTWLLKVADRPVPPGYRLYDSSATATGNEAVDDARLRKHLLAMGVPPEEATRALGALRTELQEIMPADPAAMLPEPDSHYIEPPEAMARLSTDWHLVFPLGKPFSVHNDAFNAEVDVWEPDIEADWMTFLDNHPEAFDNLDILDDLATAVFDHPQAGGGWLEETLLLPLLRRAETILHTVLEQHPAVVLAWPWTENRPALRAIARQIVWHLRTGQMDRAAQQAQRLLQLNPDDNHGFRMLLANHWLQRGEDERVLTLCAQFPDDLNPELAYGKVLALYRLDRLEDARVALQAAVKNLPRVVRFLVASRVRKPYLDPDSVQLGGDDQAWIYRDAMRETWLAVPGVLDWLKKTAKKLEKP